MATRGLAWTLLILTFALIVWGGIVHSTGSSLACPDWPLCYGEVFPEMKGGVAIEHSHRLLAATIGLLTIVLVVLLGKRRAADPRTWRLSWLALVLVILQGVLGGLTVLYQLPTLVSTAHLAVSMLFFGTLLVIALRLTAGAQSPVTQEFSASEKHFTCIKATTVAIYLQILLGALVRHTGAALACPDLPFCYGQLWPTSISLAAQLHMAHRYFGLLVGLFVIVTAWKVRRCHASAGWFSFLRKNAVFLVWTQILLGLVSIGSGLDLTIVTVHLAVGTLLFATFVSLWFFTPSRQPA